MSSPDPRDIVDFWREAGMARWFTRDDAFDATLRARYEAAHFVAARRGHEDWMATPDGALALLLLLDQFPRNLFRDSGHAFATDPLALHYAARAVDAGHDQAFEPLLRAFFYLPWEHSESAPHQARSVALLSALGNAEYTRYAVEHAEVIQRFGRFPHRNAALGRSSTDEEQAWLDAGGGF